MGGITEWFMAKLGLDTSHFNSQTQAAQNQVQNIDTKIQQQQIKLMTLWTYGNQIANLVLRQFSNIAEGSSMQTGLNVLVQGLQIAQTEVAISQTVAMAMREFAGKNPIGGSALLTIAAMMQSNLFTMTVNRITTTRAQQLAEDIRRQIEAYRS